MASILTILTSNECVVVIDHLSTARSIVQARPRRCSRWSGQHVLFTRCHGMKIPFMSKFYSRGFMVALSISTQEGLLRPLNRNSLVIIVGKHPHGTTSTRGTGNGSRTLIFPYWEVNTCLNTLINPNSLFITS